MTLGGQTTVGVDQVPVHMVERFDIGMAVDMGSCDVASILVMKGVVNGCRCGVSRCGRCSCGRIWVMTWRGMLLKGEGWKFGGYQKGSG